jgi:hypothetical protein
MMKKKYVCMIVQAAKIMGSGMATIGLTNNLLSLIRDNKLLISKIYYTDLIKKGILTIDDMIRTLLNENKNSILLKYLEEEIGLSILLINGRNINGIIKVNDDIFIKTLDKKKVSKLNNSFMVAGVYLFNGPNDEQYVGSCMNFKSRLNEHKDQFKSKRKPTKLHLFKYKFNDYT